MKLFVEKVSAKFREMLEELNEKGVKFYVCNNAVKVHKISREIVPASITKLLELQMDGYLRETLIDVCAS